MTANEALKRLIDEWGVTHVVDIGCGSGEHAAVLRALGKTVTTISLIEPADIVADWLDAVVDEDVDAIWAAHVLEHTTEPGLFLAKCFDTLPEGGLLAVTVPPAKDAIVGGHVSLWNAGLLLYHLILAGFDCSEARVGTYGYNISVLVRKKPADLPPLHMDKGDIERLARFFPLPVQQGFDGRLPNINW